MGKSLQISSRGDAEVFVPSSVTYPLIGSINKRESTEANAQCRIRDSITVSDFYIRVVASDSTAATTIVSRKNSADGNFAISVGAAATGEFEDVSNTDTLVDGDLYNYEVDRPAGGTQNGWSMSIMSTVFESATTTQMILCQGLSVISTDGTKFFAAQNAAKKFDSDDECKVIVRVAFTWDRLRAFLATNGFNGTLTLRSRINSADGNQVLSISSSSTGEFEDTLNSDSVSVADQINLDYNEAASSGSATIILCQTRAKQSTGNLLLLLCGGQSVVSAGVDRFRPLGGAFSTGNDDDRTKMKFRAANWTVDSFFFHSRINDLDGATTIENRKNGVTGNLSVSVGAATTGDFEDLVNSEDYEAGDNGDLKIDPSASSSGSMTFDVTSFSLNNEEVGDVSPPTITVTTPSIELTLSGTRAAVLNAGVYVVEHQIPGMSGGIIEKTGFPATRIQYRGFFYSGADDEMKKLHDAVGKQVQLAIPSTQSGNFFFSGIMFISRGPNMTISPGRGYAYYDYNIEFVSQS